MRPLATRRRFLHIVALTSGAGLLAACSQAAPASPTAPPAAAKPTAAPASAATTAPAAAATSASAATAAPAVATQPLPPVEQQGQGVTKDDPRIQSLYEAAKKEGKISWWDQHEQPVAQQYIDAFHKSFPDLPVDFFFGTQDVTSARLVQEARAGQVSADFIDSGQDYPNYKQAGVITDKTDFTDILALAGVQKQFIVNGTYSPEFGVYGCAYNTNLAKPEDLPDTLDGFSDPKWKGQLAIEMRLRPYVYGTPFLGGQDKVAEMLGRLKANNPRPTNGDVQSNALLIAGEFPVLIGSYLQRLVNMKGKPWGFVSLKDVASVEPGPGYIVPQGAPHPNAGKLFMWWYMGPIGMALTDELRFKGNPAPGTGTGPSKYLQEHNMTVHFASQEIEQNYKKYLTRYLDALGMPVT